MRGILSFVHITIIRLIGVLCALALYGLARTVTDWSAVPQDMILTMAPLGVGAVFCLLPRLLKPMLSPRKALDMVPLIFVAAVTPLAAMLYQSPNTLILPALSLLDPLRAAILALPVLITGGALVLLPKSTSASVPQITKRRWIDGTPWHVYLGLDFVAMRLFGLGLMGVGAVLWQLVQTGRPELAAAISFGQPVPIALYAYGAAGLLITIPIFLPGFLRVPRGPGEGVMKAAFTLGIGIVLANAVGHLWPDVVVAVSPLPLPAPLLAIPAATVVLSLQITAASVAILAVAIPMARRAAGLRYDIEGRPIIALSGTELRQLRTARSILN